MRGENRRVVMTCRMIKDALIDLMNDNDFSKISISDVCKAADVNRSTFYLHYETIDDLVNEAIETMNQRFMSYFADTKGIAEELSHTDLSNLVLITRDYLEPYLRFVSENKDLYRAAFRNPREIQANARYGYIKKYIVEPILKRFGVPNPYWKYYIAYYINGTMAIIKEWLETECQDPVEMIAAVIEECVRPGDGTQGRMYGEIHETLDQ